MKKLQHYILGFSGLSLLYMGITMLTSLRAEDRGHLYSQLAAVHSASAKALAELVEVLDRTTPEEIAATIKNLKGLDYLIESFVLFDHLEKNPELKTSLASLRTSWQPLKKNYAQVISALEDNRLSDINLATLAHHVVGFNTASAKMHHAILSKDQGGRKTSRTLSLCAGFLGLLLLFLLLSEKRLWSGKVHRSCSQLKSQLRSTQGKLRSLEDGMRSPQAAITDGGNISAELAPALRALRTSLEGLNDDGQTLEKVNHSELMDRAEKIKVLSFNTAIEASKSKIPSLSRVAKELCTEAESCLQLVSTTPPPTTANSLCLKEINELITKTLINCEKVAAHTSKPHPPQNKMTPVFNQLQNQIKDLERLTDEFNGIIFGEPTYAGEGSDVSQKRENLSG